MQEFRNVAVIIKKSRQKSVFVRYLKSSALKWDICEYCMLEDKQNMNT